MVCQSNVARSLRPWPRSLLSCAAPAKATRLTSQRFFAIFVNDHSVFQGAGLATSSRPAPFSFPRLGRTPANEPKLFSPLLPPHLFEEAFNRRLQPRRSTFPF